MHYGTRTKSLLIAALLCIVSMSVHATTWAPSKVRDPITNEHVKVHQPMSSGSYIYAWPEKSDQVFWPFTDSNWLWFNPKSGYIAFGNDFAELDTAKRAVLKDWLKANFDRNAPPQSRRDLLEWTEKVYAARGMDDDFWCHFFRLMVFETRDDSETSLAYVRKALPLLEKSLKASADPGETLKNLYLLGEYNRRIGQDDDAKRYLERLSSLEVDDKLSGFKQYLLEIAKEQQALPPEAP
jgi:tetratricopeptide (TPR) repeat protein